MRIAVGIATVGRAATMEQTAPLWVGQTRAFDRMIISCASEADLGPSARALSGVEVVMGPPGLCRQRNRILDALAGDCDVVIFADDDYVPSRHFVERVARVFADPGIVAMTGSVLADGITSLGIPFEEALQTVQAFDAAHPDLAETLANTHSTYGCNMAFRVSAAPDLRFDERLPLYGWQEDVDFSMRMGRVGRVVKAASVVGVHLGTKGGRISGVRFGYSQIANPIYLMRKGSMRVSHATWLMCRNIGMNLLKSLKPEPWVDRKGRLRGNLIAFGDALTGRQRPERILDL